MTSSLFIVYISIYFSQTIGQIETQLDRKDTLVLLHIFYDFKFIQKFSMAARSVMLSDWLRFQISST